MRSSLRLTSSLSSLKAPPGSDSESGDSAPSRCGRVSFNLRRTVNPWIRVELLVSRSLRLLKQWIGWLISQLKAAVRHFTNLFLGVKCDEGIERSIARYEDSDAIEAYQEDETGIFPMPGLFPLRPSWSHVQGAWNMALAHQFTDYMVRNVGVDVSYSEDVRNAFISRLERLSEVIHASQKRAWLREENASRLVENG